MADIPAKATLALRITGGIVLIASIIQFGIDISVYRSLTSPKLGAFWSAIITFVTCVFAVLSSNRGITITAMVFSIIAVIVGIIGCIVDGLANSIISLLVACVSNTGTVSGDANSGVFSDCFGFSDDCSCIQDNGNTCFFYNGGIAASNCDNILTTYTRNLHGAIAFDLIATIGVFVVSIITCVAVCCPQNFGAQPAAAGEVTVTSAQQPAMQVHVQNPPQQQVYGQPQPVYGQQPVVVTGVVVGQAAPSMNKY